MTKGTFQISLGKGASLDARTLIDTRMLLAGSSGSGKSHSMRVIAEQVAPQIQTIVLDPEGEYTTLREKNDLVIVGEDGELAPTVATAGKLARRLLELQVSAVVDLYALRLSDRRAFVRNFLDSMMSAPKSLWRPCFIMLDEAHRFCPERGAGQAESTESVITLLSQGRKRGYCGILATQRLQKLHKDAAAETLNNLIGRTILDVDVKRARDILGLTKGDESKLRALKPGNWYGFGPAFIDVEGICRFQGGKAQTTHPQAGKRHRIQAPGPSARIQRVIAELSEIPAQIKEEAETEAQLRREIKDLKSQLRNASASSKSDPKVDRAAVMEAAQRAAERAQAAAAAASEKHTRKLDRELAKVAQSLESALRALESARGVTYEAPEVSVPNVRVAQRSATPARRSAPVRREAQQRVASTSDGLPFSWRSAPGKVLTVMLQYDPEQLDQRRLASLAGVNWRSSTFRNAMSKLRTGGLIEGMSVTDAARDFAGDVEPLPEGSELIEKWQGRLGSGVPRRIFDALCECGGSAEKEHVAEVAEVDPSSSTFRNALSKLRRHGLLGKHRGTQAILSDHVTEAL